MWFVTAATAALEYLVTDYGFTGPEVDDQWPQWVTVSFLGPVAVQAVLEPLEEYLSIEVVVLRGGAIPSTPPITHLPIESIVRVRGPGASRAYAPPPKADSTEGRRYLQMAAADLRTHADDLLRGDLTLVEEVRTMLGDVPGVAGIDWRATNTELRPPEKE